MVSLHRKATEGEELQSALKEFGKRTDSLKTKLHPQSPATIFKSKPYSCLGALKNNRDPSSPLRDAHDKDRTSGTKSFPVDLGEDNPFGTPATVASALAAPDPAAREGAGRGTTRNALAQMCSDGGELDTFFALRKSVENGDGQLAEAFRAFKLRTNQLKNLHSSPAKEALLFSDK